MARIKFRLGFFLLISLLISSPAYSWGPDGHQEVGAIADQLIAGTDSEISVQMILGKGHTLQEASVWADCAKGVNPSQGYVYTSEGKYPECAPFETPQGELEMIDFVMRNDKNCNPKKGEESCHKQYHYADIAIQRGRYDEKYIGSRTDDIVHAVQTAITVLQGNPAPAPFNFKDKKEALRLLTHYVGDLHQPLHVGAIYLDKTGKMVDPDKGTFDPKTDTHGGNYLSFGGPANMHNKWDTVPAKLKPARLTPLVISKARSEPKTKGKVDVWPVTWASETVKAAGQAYQGVTFGPLLKGKWKTTLPADYTKAANAIKEEQVERGGGRLAQILQAIWP
jgi:hypothetical protein